MDNSSLKKSNLPVVFKINTNRIEVNFGLSDSNEGEGPFNSIYELKKQSIIYSSIQLQKHKARVLKNQHIKEITDFILTPRGSKYNKTFISALHHTMVGKISKRKVKGVHFYHPDSIKIIKILDSNDLGVYSAIIEKQHKETKKWIKKDEVTNFFPDKWTAHELFHECSFAYLNRKYKSGNTYLSKTPSGIDVKFIINKEGKIITFYPLI